MNVSHFILGIRFCAANGHNYVAKLRGAINKTELSTKSCGKQQRASPLLACGKRAARRVTGSKDGMGKDHPGLWGRVSKEEWGNSSCHPCRNGFSLAFTPVVLPGHSPCGEILPSTSQGLARDAVLGRKLWKWLRHLETQVLFVRSSALPEHRGCFLIASLVFH